MKRLLPILAALSGLLLLQRPSWGHSKESRSAQACQPVQTVVIDAEARCVDNSGIEIGIGDDESGKVGCMEDKRVRGKCGPDGNLTRLRAYTQFFNKLKSFEAECTTNGGTFSYQDPNFTEPQNESYCLQAQPEVASGEFEQPLCNYRSLCPAVTVVCNYDCGSGNVSQDDLPDMQATIRISSLPH